MSRLGLFAMIVLLLTAAGVEAVEPAYVLGPEDSISITVLRHPEFSRSSATVLADGSIDYPVIGKIKVEGLTTTELADRVKQGLSTRLREPEVTVTVDQPRLQRIYVDGLVTQAGVLNWKPGWRVSQALAAAGGVTVRPDRTVTTLFRVGHDPIRVDLVAIFVTQDPAADLPLQPGDSLHVAGNTIIVYVTGDVVQSGVLELPLGGTTRQAIAMSGGLKDTAAPELAYVMRGSEKLPLDLFKALEQGDTSADVTLQSGDAIFVPENRNAIAVFGHVVTPGYQALRTTDHVTVSHAIARAGGTTPSAASNHIMVVREENGKSVTQVVDLKAILERGQLDKDIELRPGDKILVPESGRRTPRGMLSEFYGVAVLKSLFLGGL
jgi:polysaccharide export outer membrane protein